MRARILALSLALAGHAGAQVTQVRPTVVTPEPKAMYYACWSLAGVQQSCVAAGPSYADYTRLAAFLQNQQNGTRPNDVACFPLVK